MTTMMSIPNGTSNTPAPAPVSTVLATAAPSTSTSASATPVPMNPQRSGHVEQQSQEATTESAPQPPAAMLARDRYNRQALGSTLNISIKNARVLMVGAGGIGCELLKNLVLGGYGEIHVVDLDTIDLSNLNRQFLFRHEHIKKPKALVAKEAAQKFNPSVKIVAHHASIKDAEFSVPWFRDFRIVFNALDNLDARRHVNKMCLAADVPLVESGTTGFNGQVQVIKRGITACYDCTPKETPKSFPVCTIRSTPSQPIHCIVWAKSYLLNEIFGVSEDESAFDHSSDAENAGEIEELKKESEALKQIRDAVGKPEFPKMLFNKVFNKDIERLRSVDDMWKSRRAPEALEYDALKEKASAVSTVKDTILDDQQKVWSLEESLIIFIDSLERLSRRLLALKTANNEPGADAVITFDKDDDDTLDFVVSGANIRSTIFGIERKSRFDTKQMAGNIIPAIATTNAIVAGLCVLQSFKVLKGEYTQSKEVFLTPFANARLLAPDRSRLPKTGCPVCGVYYTSLVVDLSRATLSHVVDGFIKKQLGYDDREFGLSNEVGVLYDPDETENLSKKLSDLGIKSGSFLTITDEDDDSPFVDVVIDIQEGVVNDEKNPFKPVTAGRPEIPHKPSKTAVSETNGHGQQNGKHARDKDSSEDPKGTKRQRDDDEVQPLKKAKIATDVASSDGIVVVEDAVGAIVIDD